MSAAERTHKVAFCQEFGGTAVASSVQATVTFTQLISEGFLGTNVLRDFGASEVTVFLNATNAFPGMIQMDALMPDGSHTTLLSDGSVQGFAKSRFQEYEQNTKLHPTPHD